MISDLNGRNVRTLVNVAATSGQDPIFGLAIPDESTALVSVWNRVRIHLLLGQYAVFFRAGFILVQRVYLSPGFFATFQIILVGW